MGKFGRGGAVAVWQCISAHMFTDIWLLYLWQYACNDALPAQGEIGQWTHQSILRTLVARLGSASPSNRVSTTLSWPSWLATYNGLAPFCVHGGLEEHALDTVFLPDQQCSSYRLTCVGTQEYCTTILHMHAIHGSESDRGIYCAVYISLM